MKKSASILALGMALGAGGTAATKSNPLSGTVYVRFEQQLPDGGVRDLGRTGCYDFAKVKAVIETCKSD